MSFFQEDMSGVSHDRMVELAQMRSQEAFTILFQYHRPQVYRYIASIVRNDQDAQDLTQSTFLKAWEMLPTLRKVPRFKTWLYSIARNLMFDRGRRQGKVSFQPMEDQNLVGQSNALSEPGPEEIIAQRELTQLALAEIPLHFRECLILQLVGFSLKEVAELVGINEASARTYVSSARRQFREAYSRLEQVPIASRKERFTQ